MPTPARWSVTRRAPGHRSAVVPGQPRALCNHDLKPVEYLTPGHPGRLSDLQPGHCPSRADRRRHPSAVRRAQLS
jgi:hypothetical protein